MALSAITSIILRENAAMLLYEVEHLYLQRRNATDIVTTLKIQHLRRITETRKLAEADSHPFPANKKIPHIS